MNRPHEIPGLEAPYQQAIKIPRTLEGEESVLPERSSNKTQGEQLCRTI